MGTKSGEMREMLITAMRDVTAGNIKPEQAKAIALLAQQVNLSVQVEVNAQIERLKWNPDSNTLEAAGQLLLGSDDERIVSEQ